MSTPERSAGGQAPAGRSWRIGLIAGSAIFVFGLAGLLRNARATIPADWLTWIAGALVVHDALLVPLALLAGVVCARVVPAAARGTVQATLAVGAVVALMSVPVLLAKGRRPDNPSLLPHDYARNLAIVLALIAVAGLLVVVVRAARARTGRSPTR